MEEEKRRHRGELFSWCLVANVVDEHEVGQDRYVEHGTGIFSSGAKAYVSPICRDGSFDHGGVLRINGKPRRQGVEEREERAD
ncbi:hypothetical protein [Bifidobacterium samirii]|uniref:hypothetical protein n=1 Tax=Bifidobacterium samirii TaxID=2306974 RepID=UPI000F7E6042|nr:hypothetical protein [Bifidobacterium samirii]